MKDSWCVKGKLQNCSLWQKNLKLIIVKPGSQSSGYVSNFAQNQKYKAKTKFAFILKEMLLHFKVKKFSFYFWFKKTARFKFFPCISNKIISYSWILYRYPGTNFALPSIWFPIIYVWETRWIWVIRHILKVV